MNQPSRPVPASTHREPGTDRTDPASPDATGCASTGQATAAPAALGAIRLALLLVWAVASFGTCYFARDLQAALPSLSAYGLAAQGILIVFILLVVFNAWFFDRRETRLSAEAADGG
ncbi:DUF4212 domain-containing protein [Xylophilus sp. Kf1]|nr:DUF4212 domain-containing protein [Xylophilus sp. Kf1]